MSKTYFENWWYDDFAYPPLPLSYVKQKEEVNMDKKFWMICGLGGKYDTYEAAEKVAKQRVNQTHSDAVIMEAVAVATFPLADITVNKLTETTASK